MDTKLEFHAIAIEEKGHQSMMEVRGEENRREWSSGLIQQSMIESRFQHH